MQQPSGTGPREAHTGPAVGLPVPGGILDRQPQQPQQMGFSTQSQRQQWQGAEAAPEAVQPSYSQGNADDFSEINDTDDLPF